MKLNRSERSRFHGGSVVLVPIIPEFLTTDADGAGVMDVPGLFTPAADARRLSPVFFVLNEVVHRSTGMPSP